MSRRDPYVPILHMLDNARDARDLYAERSRRGDWDADPTLRDALNAALIRYMEVLGEARASGIPRLLSGYRLAAHRGPSQQADTRIR